VDIPTLQTERLTLRAYRPDEFDFYASMVGTEEGMRYIDAPLDKPAAFRSFCAMFGHWHVRGHGMWLIEERATNRLVGHAGLPHWFGSAGMEVGYALHPAAWGEGFATEACRAVLGHAHHTMGARDVLSVIHPENVASMRVAERLGARWHGREQPWKNLALRVFVHPNP
jgi:ribosomal-protein-alanine N-acetyltransferase